MNIRQSVATATCITLLVAPMSALAGGFFVGASIGKANLNEDFDGLNVDTDSTSYRISAGWRFNDYFALEGGYHNFGDFEQSFDDDGDTINAKLSADGFLLGAIGTIPLGERFALTARAGGFFWNGAAEINGVSQAMSWKARPPMYSPLESITDLANSDIGATRRSVVVA